MDNLLCMNCNTSPVNFPWRRWLIKVTTVPEGEENYICSDCLWNALSCHVPRNDLTSRDVAKEVQTRISYTLFG